MKISGRCNYKPGPKDECGSPAYATVSLIPQIEQYRKLLHIPREKFVIWEPATGLTARKLTGLKDGFNRFGYPVFHQPGVDFLTADFDQVQNSCYKLLGVKICMVATNPPFSVALKRQFISKCYEINKQALIPWALLMNTTTLVEKINGRNMRGCALHIPLGRICYNMPEKGWGTIDNPTKATFVTNWFSYGLVNPYNMYYSNFDVSDHFEALKTFYSNDFNIEELEYA